MKRRKVLAGILGAGVGAGAVIRLQRADILLRSRMWRARGEPATIRVDGTPPDTDDDEDEELPVDRWVELETKDVASEQIFSVIEGRSDEALGSIGSSVSALVFGPVITVSRRTTYDRSGERIGSPKIGRQRLIRIAPRTVRVVIKTPERLYQRRYPVAVSDTVGHLQ